MSEQPSEKTQETSILELIRESYGKICFVLGVGAISGLANIEHGPGAVLTAGLKQTAYSAVSAAFLLSIYNYLEKRVKSLPGELVPIIVPTLITIAANLTVHSLKGTAEPILSTLPTALLATIGFPIWHVRTRILQLWKDIETMKIEF
ncbi:MAG: hypothetical protein WC608_05875 [Parcubacteria group bacterium]